MKYTFNYSKLCFHNIRERDFPEDKSLAAMFETNNLESTRAISPQIKVTISVRGQVMITSS